LSQERGYETVVRGCPRLGDLDWTIHGNSGTPIPFHPFPVFESGEIVIDRLFTLLWDLLRHKILRKKSGVKDSAFFYFDQTNISK